MNDNHFSDKNALMLFFIIYVSKQCLTVFI